MDTSCRSPWITMWTQPRQTIRRIVNTDPYHHVKLLAAIAGIGEALNRASGRSTGDSMPLLAILAIAVILGPIGGIISLHISGALLKWTGGWIGGRAEKHEIRAAIAWSGVIGIWLMILWVPELLLFGKEMFTTETPRMDSSTTLTTLFWLFALIEIVFGIWAFVVYLKSLGEVQGFSAWKAFGNVLLSGLVIIVPILGIAAIIMLAT